MKEEFKVRLNVMKVSSMEAFAGIRGGMNRNCKDVCFCRMLGANATFLQDLEKMDAALRSQAEQNRLFYVRIPELSVNIKPQEADYYSACYSDWAAVGRSSMTTKLFPEHELFAGVLGHACREVILKYNESGHPVNDSIEKNFLVKLMYWLDKFFAGRLPDWYPGISVKVVADNVYKGQEYLFFYLLALLGFDVLLLQSRGDIGEAFAGMELSEKNTLGPFSDISLPPAGCMAEEVGRDSRRDVSRKAVNTPDSECAGVQRENIVLRIPPRPDKRDCAVGRKPVPAGRADAGMDRKHNENRHMEKTYEELALLASSVVQIAIRDSMGNVLGTGSGIMIGTDGYILTNNHVASGGRVYSVRIEDDEQIYDTDEIIKYNPVLDLAVIRIHRKLAPLPIYRGPQKLVRGQRVVAIGSPLGLFNSVSDGIISGFRKIDNVDMIQFTAPISHGSSGGAVLNMYGEVIGISTAGIDSGQNINLAMGYECINLFVKGFV